MSMNDEKPYVIINAAMTLDGKIATAGGDSAISGKEDLIRVHKLRAECDGILVGINTVIKDNPRLTVHKIKSERNPVRIVVDSRARIPLSARMFREEGETIIAVSEKANKKKVERLKSIENVNVASCGKEEVDLKKLMKILYKRGIKKLLVEGGGNVIFSFLKEKLADEIRVAIAPVVVGGENAITLAEGKGFSRISDGANLMLKKSYALGKDLVLEYKIKRQF